MEQLRRQNAQKINQSSNYLFRNDLRKFSDYFQQLGLCGIRERCNLLY